MSSQPETNRSSVPLLLRALERNDQRNLPGLSKAVLYSTYDHLFHGYSARTRENGQAISTVLVAQWELHAGAKT
jgi:hypothetical protein